MSTFKLKATHAPVKAYYETLKKFGLGKCARPYEWFVVSEYQIARSGKSPLRVDAAVASASR